MAEAPTPLAEIDHGPGKLEQFLDAHQKKLIIALIAIALAVVAYVVYSGMEETKNQEAGSELVDSEELADYQDVAKKWSGTATAGSAQVFIADLQWGDSQQNSIDTLNKFIDENTDHPALPTAQISLAMRLLEQGKTDDAKSILESLTGDDEASFIAPLAHIVLGDIAKASGDADAAVRHYTSAGGTNPPASSPSANAFADTASSRLSLVHAVAPTKIKPAPPKPVAPPKPTTLPVPPKPNAPATPAGKITPAPPALPTTPGEAPKLELPGSLPKTPPAEGNPTTPPATPKGDDDGPR